MKPLSDVNEWPKFAVYDIEAENWVDVVLVGHVDEYGNRVHFPSIPLYLDWLFSPKFQGQHVWAHWGGHYDHRFVIHHATVKGWPWETVQSGNTIIIVTVKHPNGRTIHFCESARLMPDSVERIGNTVGLQKLDVDRAHIEKLSAQETIDYCMRDCDIVLKGLQYLREALLSVGADFAYTLASIASRWVRHSDVLNWMKFYDRDGTEPTYSKTMLMLDEFSLPAYFGGRVEVFKRGTFEGPLYYYDIRSSYPWSMLHDLPAYPRGPGFYPPRTRIDKSLARCGISEATVTVPASMYIPLLCKRVDGKLMFPTGRFRGRWTNLELSEAYRRGVGVEIHGQAVFEPKPFLRPFVETFYALRQKALDDGDPFRSYAYKIALNSLYGKLVESVERLSVIFGGEKVSRAMRLYGAYNPAYTREAQPNYIRPTKTPGVYAVVTQSEGPFRHVAAGAYVTARSRMRLIEGLELARSLGGKVFYCDTDSLVTDVELGEHPLMTDELGGFKLEAVFSEAEFVGPKVYRAVTTEGETIYKVKGIPVRGISADDSQQRWEDYISGVQVEKDGISGFSTDIRAGSVKPSRQVLRRALKSVDSKRLHDDHGNSTPVRIVEGGSAGV